MPTLDKTPAENTGAPESVDTKSAAAVQEAVQDKTQDTTPPPLVRNRYADTMNKPKKRLPKPVRILLWIIFIAAVVAGGFYLIQKSKQTTQNTTAKTATAQRGFLETYVEGDGRTAAKTRAELGKDIKGKVLKINVATGDTVKAGQVLMTIDPTETRKELETAQTSLNEAQKGVSDANKTLSNLAVTAPFTGRLLPPGESTDANTETTPPAGESKAVSGSSTQEVKIQAGQEVAAGTTLGTLVDDTNMRLELYYSYAYIDKLKIGADAVISIPQTMGTVTGKVDKIEYIEKISDEGSRLFRATITFHNPGTLKAGMAATATVAADGLNIAPTESGKLAYSREMQIVTKAAGKASAACAPSYQKFSAGQTILRLTSDEATSALTSAQQLIKTRQDTVNDLTKRIQQCTVTSPIDGIVMSLNATEGENLSGTSVPCVVADPNNIVINANISMTDVSHVQVGQSATIKMEFGTESMTFNGTVQSVALEANKNENNSQGSMPTFPAIISVEPSEGQTLRPDFSVNYRITTAQAEDCITVPSSAVVNTADGVAVFVKPAEGQTFENALPLPEGSDVPEGFVLVPIKTGLADAENTEVVSGLDEGTTVLLAGPQDRYNMDDSSDSGNISDGLG